MEEPIPTAPKHTRKGLLGGALATGLAMLMRQGVSIAVAIVVARQLGASGKGELAVMSQYVAVAAMLLGLGIDAAHSYYVGRRGRRVDEALSDTIAFVAIVGSAGAIVLSALFFWVVPALEGVARATLILAATMLVPSMLASGVGGILIGVDRVRQLALATMSASVATFAVVMLGLATGRMTLGLTVFAMVGGSWLTALGSVAALRAGRLPRPSLARLREEVSYALKSYVQNVTGYLELRQDVLLLGFMASSSAVGVYSTGASLAELALFIPQAAYTSLIARSLQESHTEGARLTSLSTRLMFAIALITALALALVAQPLVVAVFGPEFSEAAKVVYLLIPGTLSWALFSQAQAFLASHGRLFPRLGLLAWLLNLVLNLVLIPRLGIYGAAISTSISYTIGNAYIVAVFLRTTKTPLGDMVAIRVDDLRLLKTAAVAMLRRG